MTDLSEYSGNLDDLRYEERAFSVNDLTPPPSEAARERNAERSGPPITLQPRRLSDENSEEGHSGSTGVATIEGNPWSMANISRYVPMQGLDFLLPVDYVFIQQTIELVDLLSSVESENRYLVKSRSGETIFVAAEQSSQSQRQCCGSSRAFSMRLFDMNRQESLSFQRSLGASMCCCPCCLQQLDVYAPGGRIIGRVQQEWTLMIPEFFIQDSSGKVVYRLQGPNVCGCFMFSDADFKIMTKDGYTQVGTISHGWDDFLHAFTLSITFPAQATVELKAVLIGAAFLLEYLYFLRSKTKSWMRFCRLRC
ncbi:phospholipid scramblase 1-like isoform X2 [Neocloeon triangulifer]|uniref:phospholipid scramblase 1-like isoform X2 n=1 Tax=Neocloeon triangulifer TaxID=2078957 RepID=UPI00286F415A|nr:phospholipid scramblase 1-like isoform X2 [Neocloeon triangulifer]